MKQRLRREEWERHVTTWRESGKSAEEYCVAQGLQLSTLRSWSGRLAKERKAAASSGFARVRRRPRERSSSVAVPLRVLCGDAVVEVPSAFDAVALRRVLDVLRSSGDGR